MADGKPLTPKEELEMLGGMVSLVSLNLNDIDEKFDGNPGTNKAKKIDPKTILRRKYDQAQKLVNERSIHKIEKKVNMPPPPADLPNQLTHPPATQHIVGNVVPNPVPKDNNQLEFDMEGVTVPAHNFGGLQPFVDNVYKRFDRLETDLTKIRELLAKLLFIKENEEPVDIIKGKENAKKNRPRKSD